ncbi:unnamed protein product [Rotaria magnacalcarata]
MKCSCSCSQWDDQRYLYASDTDNDAIWRYQIGHNNGTVVADGNGNGDRLNQLNTQYDAFVDQQQAVIIRPYLGTLYVSVDWNDRVTRWPKGATQSTIVAGGNGHGEVENQLSRPDGLTFDRYDNFYVVDYGNYRVQRFSIK